VSDVIDRLLSVEHEARGVIARAEREAEEILERARRDARRLVAEAQEEAREKAAAAVERVESALGERMAERLEREEKDLPSVERIAPAHMARAVETAVDVVAPGLAARMSR